MIKFLNKKTKFLFLFVSFLICSNISFSQVKKVVIDAGHGGKDCGAIGKVFNTYEKDIALNIALELGNLIKEKYNNYIEVIYTRDKDCFVELKERADIANKSKADLFISIHSNSLPKSNMTIYGTETFVLGLHRSKENFEVAQKENSVITLEDEYSTTYEGFDPNSAESYIIFTMMQNEFLENSLLLASYIEDKFKTFGQRNSRGVKQAGFLVLYKTSMPSILIETGFLSNIEEEKFLKSYHGQKKIANSIFLAFKKYTDNINKTTSINRKEMIQKDSINKTEEKIIQPIKVKYCIQIVSSTSRISTKNDYFKGLKVDEIYIDGKYKYVIGNEKKYEDIKKILKKLKNSFNDIFIIAIKGNSTISISEAKKNELKM